MNKRELYKSLIIGNKHKKHIEVVYYKNILDIRSISYENNYRTVKRLYDKAVI
ncbi:MAG: hypothetical protein WC343_02835 [Bacilli bacterium]|jgi:hypothetical protein